MSTKNEPKNDVTEKTIDELEDVSWEVLEKYTHGGALAGQERVDLRHDKSKHRVRNI